MNYRIQTYDEVPSTNEIVRKAMAEGAAEGLVVVARSQTHGYGRYGRAWISPRGGLYVSIGLRPSVPVEQLPTLSLVMGLAVHDVAVSCIDPREASHVRLKWPNDVVYDVEGCSMSSGADAVTFRKLCGISLERFKGSLCIGVGINVLEPEKTLEGDIRNRPICLEQLGYGPKGSRDRALDHVLERFLEVFEGYYTRWIDDGLAPFISDYDALACLTGHEVVLENQTGIVVAAGYACGIDREGRLIVKTPEGDFLPISSGEARLV